MGVISAILAILKAVPVLDSWFQKLAIAYSEWKIAEHDKAFTDGMNRLLADHDQRGLEDAAGMGSGPDPDQSELIRRPRSEH